MHAFWSIISNAWLFWLYGIQIVCAIMCLQSSIDVVTFTFSSWRTAEILVKWFFLETFQTFWSQSFFFHKKHFVLSFLVTSFLKDVNGQCFFFFKIIFAGLFTQISFTKRISEILPRQNFPCLTFLEPAAFWRFICKPALQGNTHVWTVSGLCLLTQWQCWGVQHA